MGSRDPRSNARWKDPVLKEYETPLRSTETDLVGRWSAGNGQVATDSTCERIEWLISHSLRRIGVSTAGGGWDTLYQDPNDGRFWECTYPQSDQHGGGPPRLKVISREEALRKFTSP